MRALRRTGPAGGARLGWVAGSSLLLGAAQALAAAPPPVDAVVPIAAPAPPPEDAVAPLAREGEPGLPSAPPSPRPLPDFMAGKRKLDPFDLSQKSEGFYATPLPLFDSDPDTGFGFGARVYAYWDGPKDDPLYEYTPYRHRVSAMTFVTTGGYQYHSIDYDGPYLGDSPYRLRAELYYEKNIAANYFGRGESTLAPLRFPGAPGASFTSFDAYTQALNAPRAGIVYTLYNKFYLEDPTLDATLERDFLKSLVRVQAGLAGRYVRVVDYSLETLQAEGAGPPGEVTSATEGPTLLHADCARGVLIGCGGGWNNTLKLGVALDTRDYEPDPNSGVFIDAVAEIGTRALGSSFDYVRVTTSPRIFWSPFPKLTDLVLAARAVFSGQTSGAPFFSMSTLGYTDGDHRGLGGVWTLRGYNQDRFVGSIATLANVELRWTFANFGLLGQRFGLAAVPFLDIGRVFDRMSDFTLAGWKRGEGGGMRIAWNKATIVRADFGVSDEGFDYYMDFMHTF